MRRPVRLRARSMGVRSHRLALALAFLCAAVLGREARAGEDGTPAAPGAEASIEVLLFVRDGCGHCRDAEQSLRALARERGDLRVTVLSLTGDPAALARLSALAAETGTVQVAAPSLYVRGTLVVGWAGATSEQRVRALLDRSGPAPAAGEEEGCPVDLEAPACEEEAEVTLPLLGAVRLRDVGLPLFTVAVGLVDGFNPCAMWVLLFLLSILVNLRSRARMLAIAGTFVLVSGLCYYAFMAAWLNFFLLVGLARWVQVALGTVAVLAGIVHVKDFFAFHRGLSLSIPESAKPGIYARARRVLTARGTGPALVGVVGLAFLVNAVELLCTAGLPALYTQVLTQQGLSRPAYYAYLGLYQAFYMLDDALMLAVAVVTLSRHRLQERSGRVLKLVSGSVMLVLGLLLLFRPEWLLW